MPLNKETKPNSTYLFYMRLIRDGVVNVLNCDILVKEFELQSRYYVYFQTDTRANGINPLIPSKLGVK